MNATDLTHLNGRSVLVKSTVERGDPAIALRGTLEVSKNPQGWAMVRIVLEFPDMCNRAAHQGIIALDEAGVERLLASEHEGGYEYTIDRPFDVGSGWTAPGALL
jgi:hypothetical protein